jgi:hypothetical protein
MKKYTLSLLQLLLQQLMQAVRVIAHNQEAQIVKTTRTQTQIQHTHLLCQMILK